MSWPDAPRMCEYLPLYGYLLGGKDNYAADREAAQQVLREISHSELACRQNRAFLGRAVRYLAESQGITQFLGIGSGLPTSDNVH
jgi:S-adenosyl methyltransferase